MTTETGEPGGPEVAEDDDDCYSFLWKDAGYRFTVENFRDGSEGVSAEVRIRTTTAYPNGRTGHVHLSRLNLLSTSARATLVRQLEKRIPAADWEGMVEYAATAAVLRHRRGEPAVDLADVDATDTVPFLLRDLVPEGETSVLFAAGGSAKSYLALAMCVAVATGEPVGNLFLPNYQCNALYLDYETRRETHARRLALFCRGAGLPGKIRGIYYRRLYRPVAEEVRQVRALVREKNIGLVIVDSLGPASGGEQEKADATIRALNALRALGAVTVVVISHVTRQVADQERGHGKPFGSVFVENLARQCWEVRKAASRTGATLDLGLFCTKVNEGQPPGPFGCRLTWDTEARWVRLGRTDIHDDPELIAHGSAVDRILALLREGARPTNEIAEALVIPVGTVRGTLKRLKDAGQVEVLSSGFGRGANVSWALVSKVPR